MTQESGFSKVLPQPATVQVGEKDVQLKPVSPLGFAQVEQDIRNDRRQRFLNGIRNTPLPDAVIAKALAEIELAGITLVEILGTHSGQMRYIWRAAGCPPWNEFCRDLDPNEVPRLVTLIGRLSGLLTEETEGDAERPLVFGDTIGTTK